MNTQIIKVYYGSDALPYKDKERSVHFPITGSTFVGSSDTTKIRFYVDGYLADENALWISVSKRADGTQGSQFLTSGTDEEGDKYREMTLSGWYTEKKGDLYISLKGYQGGSTGYWDEDTGMYVVEGVPVIRATGSIKLAINYAPVGEYPNYQDDMATFQDVVAQLSGKLNITSGIKVVDNIAQVIIGNEQEGQLFYTKATKKLYELDNGSLVVFFETYDKDTLDTKFSEKVDKLVTHGTSVYSHTSFTQGEIKVSESLSNAGGTIPIRTSNGQVAVATPTEYSHAANKGYVDYSLDSTKSLLLGKINDTGHKLAIVSKPNYIFDIQLLDGSDNVLNYVSIDLPTESIVVSGSYDEDTKSIILTLENGSAINIPVGDLVEGLIDEQALQQALQPYVKELEVSSVLTTNDLLTNVGTNKDFVLDNMGEPLLCYISEDSGTYTISFFGKDRCFHSTFSDNTLVINLLSNSTLDIDYLPIIELSSPMQILTSSQMQIANQDNSVIKYANRLYQKCNDSGTTLEFVSVDYDIVDEGANNKITKYEITVNKSTGATNMITMYLNVYSVGEIDNLLQNYAHTNGAYQNMTVGKSLIAKQIENINDDVGSTQTNPFLFQGTGTNNNTTETPTSPVAKHLELRGNSVKWNQLVTGLAGNTAAGITTTKVDNSTIQVSGTATSRISRRLCNYINAVQNHKYLIKGMIPNNDSISLIFNGYSDSAYVTTYSGKDTGEGVIITNSNANVTRMSLELSIPDGTEVTTFSFKPQVYDLTAIYGAGNEPTSALAFNRDYPKSYYSYNAGELKSCSSSKLVTIGCNQLNELNTFIKVIAGQTYELSGVSAGGYIEEYDSEQNLIKTSSEITSTTQITLTNNTHYVKVQATTYSNSMFRLYWNETHEYVPYIKHEYDLPSVELRRARNAYDTITPNGVYTKRIEVVDLGTLSWTYVSAQTRFISSDLDGTIVPGRTYSSIAPNIICVKYITTGNKPVFEKSQDKIISTLIDNGKTYIAVRDTDYTSASTFKAAMSGVMLYFELETPIVSEISAFAENIEVDDFGTMEFVPSIDNVEPIIPQGNKFFYPVDYVLFIDDMYNRSKDGGETSSVNNFVTQSELREAVGDIDLSNYVDLDSAQTISGVKTFSNGIVSSLLKPNGNTGLLFNDNVTATFHSSVVGAGGTRDLGTLSTKWKDLYLAGSLKDGNNSVSIADLAALIAYAKAQGWIQ